jgi:hypothetical protein
MLLPGLINLYFLSKVSNLLFMLSLPFVQNLNVIDVDFLSLLGAEQLPNRVRLVFKLLVNRIGNSTNELLSKLGHSRIQPK